MTTYPGMHSQVPKVVCFVCGSLGAQSYTLHVKAREKGPYFPFLELHDPPSGAKLPVKDGTVESCRVCYYFLTQQWDSFEQSKTPAIKRLYWLKRTDNGNFTGAEMRLQGEYAAQVMGLQYTPGSFGSGVSGYNSESSLPYPPQNSLMSPASTTSTHSYNAANNHRISSSPPKKPKLEPPDHHQDNGALDLSVPPPSLQPPPPPAVVVKQVGDQGGSRRRERGGGEVSGTSSSSSRARSNSKDRDNSSAPSTMICYLCAAVQPYHMGRYVHSRKNVEGEGHFPFLEQVNPPPGSMPMTPQGITRICSNCRTSLNRQWRMFEANGTNESERMYRIQDEPVSIYLRQNNPSSTVDIHNKTKYGVNADLSAPHDFQNACYLCGQVYHKDSMKLLYTRCPAEGSKHTMFFPFVAQLQKPVGARPVDSEGRIWSCRACYSYLQRQWKAYQAEGVSMKNRQFQLRPLTGVTKTEPTDYVDSSSRAAPPPPQDHHRPRSNSSGQNVGQPLNIDVSSAPTTTSSTSALGLLAIASSHSRPLPVPVSSAHPGMGVSGYQTYPYSVTNPSGSARHPPPPASNTPVDPDKSALRKALTNGFQDQDSKNNSSNPSQAREPTESPLKTQKSQESQPVANAAEVKPGVASDNRRSGPVVCFICGYDCHNRVHPLQSYPNRSGGKEDTREPFFPFLGSYDAPKKADKIDEEGMVKSCRYCFTSLTSQWKQYEKSAIQGGTNRWLWRYIKRSYSCYVCGVVAKRDEVRTISLLSYPGLEHHTLLQGEIQMVVSDMAIVCTRCDHTLLAQAAQFEQANVLPRQRNYVDLARALLDHERRSMQKEEKKVCLTAISGTYSLFISFSAIFPWRKGL